MESLISYDDSERSLLNGELLDRLCKKIGNRRVAIIAITGKFRGGKSFACNALLRRLRNRESKSYEKEEIIGRLLEKSLNKEYGISTVVKFGENGIAFESGFSAHTKGIQVWTEVFSTIDENGEEIAVLLFDTQGTFDLESGLDLSMKISLITLLLSSFMIQNNKHIIDAQDFSHIATFLSLARKDQGKIGQNFLFLMRDRVKTEQYMKTFEEFGIEGGKEYLDDLKIVSRKSAELAGKVKDLENAVEKLEAFMLPYPGPAVEKAQKEIKAGECAEEFLRHLNDWANHVVKNLQPKKVTGTILNGESFRSYVQQISKHVTSLDLKGISSAFEATALWSFEMAKKRGFEAFNCIFDKMNEETMGTKSLYPSSVKQVLLKAQESAVEIYQSVSCIGSLKDKHTAFQDFQQTLAIRCENFQERYADSYNREKLEETYTKCLEFYKNAIKGNSLLSNFHKAVKREVLWQKHKDAQVTTFHLFAQKSSSIDAQPLIEYWRNRLIKKIEEIHEKKSKENEQRLLREELVEACSDVAVFYDALLMEETPQDEQEISTWTKLNKEQAKTIFDNHFERFKGSYLKMLGETLVDALRQQVKETDLEEALELVSKDFTMKRRHEIQNSEFQRELEMARERSDEQAREAGEELLKIKKKYEDLVERQRIEIEDLQTVVQSRDIRVQELEYLLDEAATTLSTSMEQTNETLKEWKKERKRETKRREDPTEMRRREFEGESQKCSICREEIQGIGFCCKSCRFVDLCRDCKHEHEHEEDLVKLSFDDDLTSYTCDGCDLRIRGYRYKCVSCVDYDLCEDCMGDKHLHHRLLRITRSAVWREERNRRAPLENDPFQHLHQILNRQRNRQGENECRQQ